MRQGAARVASRRHGQDQGSRRSRAARRASCTGRRAPARASRRASARRSTSAAARRTAPQPRSYAYRPPRKMRAGRAAQRALAQAQGGQPHRRRQASSSPRSRPRASRQVLKALQVAKGALIVDAKGNENLRLSIRNIPNTTYPAARRREPLRPASPRRTWCSPKDAAQRSRSAAAAERPEDAMTARADHQAAADPHREGQRPARDAATSTCSRSIAREQDRRSATPSRRCSTSRSPRPHA